MSRLTRAAPGPLRDDRLERWVDALVRTPGLTAVTDPAEAWAVHVEASLAGLPLITEGPVADVGSGGGSPGIPLAAALPACRVDLVEASARKCDFLASVTTELENVTVVHARAEDWGRGAGRDAYAVVVARALAPQAVAAEWCLPLVRPAGVAVLYAGMPAAGLEQVARALGAEGPEVHAVAGRKTEHLIVFRKVTPTPQRFPRRPGVARKRPLGPTRNLHSDL